MDSNAFSHTDNAQKPKWKKNRSTNYRNGVSQDKTTTTTTTKTMTTTTTTTKNKTLPRNLNNNAAEKMYSRNKLRKTSCSRLAQLINRNQSADNGVN